MRIGPYFEDNDGWIHGSMSDMQEIVSHRSVALAVRRVSRSWAVL